MYAYNRVFALVITLNSLLFFKSVIPFLPDPSRKHDITGLARLAPVVLIAQVVNISVDSYFQGCYTHCFPYFACLEVREVLKNEESVMIPKTFCTGEFGTERECLVHVYPNTTYVFYLDTDLKARYDGRMSAAIEATKSVVALARKGNCNVKNVDNSTTKCEPRRCGGELMVNKKVNISSPNFPYEYPPDITCVWRLCPRPSYRLKFHFNEFYLHKHDEIQIVNEYSMSQDPWRRYCESKSPGEFVSPYKSKCVQLKLISKTKYDCGDRYNGLSITVQPTRAKRTRFDVHSLYCKNAFVMKGRCVPSQTNWRYSSNKVVKVSAVDIFKVPDTPKDFYDIKYSNKDTYGCHHFLDCTKDYFLFANIDRYDGGLIVQTAIAADSGEAKVLERKLPKYRNEDIECSSSLVK